MKRDLAPFLSHKSNHVTAAAATLAERLEVRSLAPELVDAFCRLMQDPATRDQGCSATLAIVRALIAIEDPAFKVYFLGIRHVQLEGSFGPPVDVAAPLRGLCAQGLARMSHADALEECVTLLADPEVPARTGAIRAIADSGRAEGALVLRLKALVGDEEEEVTSECFAALLRLAPGRSLEFVGKFMGSGSDEIAQRAALALGESRMAAAFPLLREALEHTAGVARRRTLLLAMAMLRQDEALEFLLARLEQEPERAAADTLASLALYARDEAVRKRIEGIVAGRKSAALDAVFGSEFK